VENAEIHSKDCEKQKRNFQFASSGASISEILVRVSAAIGGRLVHFASG
jgi:hypothetical protein